jgi:Mnd1 HTH domain/Leucine zipper with capping helix domain
MSRKKGLSFEEKTNRMADFFYETEEVFNLKELEKRCNKEKGIVANTVKDVLLGLTADNLVCADKVGSQNLYWQFPSQSLLIRQRREATINEELETRKRSRDELEAEHQELRQGREPSEERSAKLQRVAELTAERAELREQVATLADADPELIEALQADARQAVDAANRWTDNVFMLRDWCKTKFGIEPSRFDQGFSVPEDFDYVE